MDNKLTSTQMAFINKDRIKSIERYNKDIEKQLSYYKDRLKTDKSDAFLNLQKKSVLESIKKYTYLLKSNKDYISKLKKAK
jgi:hypothetical protein